MKVFGEYSFLLDAIVVDIMDFLLHTYLHIFEGIIFEDWNSVIFHALSDTQCNINIKFAEFRVRVPYPTF